MQHLSDIASLVKTLQQSTKIHALIVQSAPGFAKSSTINRVLSELNIPFRSLGSYSSPLFLYNSLCETPDTMLVLDDCAVFGDPAAMAILKAATWPSSGSDGQRVVAWGSTAEKVMQPSVVFTGKILMLTNAIPGGRSAESFLSRALYLHLEFSPNQIEEMLLEAARNPQLYADADQALNVAKFLIKQLKNGDTSKISLRTLEIGYELALANPEKWRVLLPKLLPNVSPSDLVLQLNENHPSVDDQVKEFIRRTGLSRRTFFNYRKKLKLASGFSSEVVEIERYNALSEAGGQHG